MAKHIYDIGTVCRGLIEAGDDGSLSEALAAWMARPCESAEMQWLTDNGRMLDWVSIMARRLEIVRHELNVDDMGRRRIVAR